MVLKIAQIHGAAGHVQQDDGFARFYNGLCQLPLNQRKQKVQLVAGGVAVSRVPLFALQSLVQT